MKKSTHVKAEGLATVKAIVLTLASIGLVSLPITGAYANPQDSQVVAGSAIIRQETPNKIGITQTTDKAIIDWRSYSIGANEHVQYYQPAATSVTLNRVVGADPSQILGRLTANGQVFLVNPNGIYFGKNAQIDVAGLVASTHNIRNEDFLAGRYLFNIPGAPGAAVINEGTIRIADTGIAAFVAPSVANRGVLVAKLGKVALASANGFTLDFTGDQLITFLVDDSVAQTAFDLEGNQLTSFVENAGRIEAQGGYVLLTAKAAENAIHGVINQTGVIEATTVGTHKGTIILNAGTGSLNVAGTLDASAPDGGNGGFIETSGQQLSFDDNVVISTFAPMGKTGNWLLDPLNIIISAGGIAGYNAGTTLGFASNPGGTSIIDPNLLNNALSNVELQATQDITFSSMVTMVNAGVGLTAKAGRDILVNANITTNNGDINLLAGYDFNRQLAAAHAGNVNINGAVVNSGTGVRNMIGSDPTMNGLVGYWQFNGNANDGSGNGNNGTANLGGVSFVQDGNRWVIKFGGINNPGAIFVPNSNTLQFNSNMTLSYWVRIDATTGMDGWGGNSANSGQGWAGAVVAKSHDRSGFVSHVGGSATLNTWLSNNAFSTPQSSIGYNTATPMADAVGQWHHVTYTFTNNESKMYLDGVLVQTQTGVTNNFSSSNTQGLYFGKFSDSWYPLNGAIDEVRLYNRTLTGSEALTLFNGSSLITTPVTPVTPQIAAPDFCQLSPLSCMSMPTYYAPHNLYGSTDVLDYEIASYNNGGTAIIKNTHKNQPTQEDADSPLGYVEKSRHTDSTEFFIGVTKEILGLKQSYGYLIDGVKEVAYSDGSVKMEFPVFNNRPLFVAVEVMDQHGNVVDTLLVEPKLLNTSVTDDMKEKFGSWFDNKDGFKDSSISKETSIDIVVPKGGVVKMSYSSSAAQFANASNMIIDTLVSALGGALPEMNVSSRQWAALSYALASGPLAEGVKGILNGNVDNLAEFGKKFADELFNPKTELGAAWAATMAGSMNDSKLGGLRRKLEGLGGKVGLNFAAEWAVRSLNMASVVDGATRDQSAYTRTFTSTLAK